MRVVVVGATGNIGSSLVRLLSGDASVTSVLGVARRVPDWELPKVSWAAADISRDPLDLLAGADAVVHLAWKIQPQRDEPEMRATNVDGTRRLLDAVVRHGVPAAIVASSVGAYSRGPKDRPVDESWPTTGIPSSTYSRHKAEQERVLDDVERHVPDLRLVRMRTSLVFQRAAASEQHRIFLGKLVPWHLPRVLRLVPSIPRLVVQATHADDIAEAYRLAVVRDVRGAFNVAAEPVLTPRLIAAAVGGRTLPVPAWALRAAADASFRLRLQPSEAGWLDMALGTPILDSTRAREELGWRERRTSVDALRELVDGIGAGAGGPTVPLQPRRG